MPRPRRPENASALVSARRLALPSEIEHGSDWSCRRGTARGGRSRVTTSTGYSTLRRATTSRTHHPRVMTPSHCRPSTSQTDRRGDPGSAASRWRRRRVMTLQKRRARCGCAPGVDELRRHRRRRAHANLQLSFVRGRVGDDCRRSRKSERSRWCRNVQYARILSLDPSPSLPKSHAFGKPAPSLSPGVQLGAHDRRAESQSSSRPSVSSSWPTITQGNASICASSSRPDGGRLLLRRRPGGDGN